MCEQSERFGLVIDVSLVLQMKMGRLSGEPVQVRKESLEVERVKRRTDSARKGSELSRCRGDVQSSCCRTRSEHYDQNLAEEVLLSVRPAKYLCVFGNAP